MSDTEKVFHNAISRKRILQKSDHQGPQDACRNYPASKSANTRFRKRIIRKNLASIDVSDCDSALFDKFVAFATDNNESLSKELQTRISQELLACDPLLDRIKCIPNEQLRPDPWTVEMMNQNGFEPRQFGTFVLRPCSEGTDCLSRHITLKCDCSSFPILAECLNADIVKKLIWGETVELADSFQQFGVHPCQLCRAQHALQVCMNPLHEVTVTFLDYIRHFSFEFVELSDIYSLKCQLLVRDTGVYLNYNALNVSTVLNTLNWLHSVGNDGEIIHRIDFTHLRNK